jgi:1-acyl-sn-glycerol-3-phosphate acyltransferase
VVRHDWRHADRLPRAGGVIVAANHISNADPLVLGWFVHRSGRQARFLAKEEVFRLPVLGPLFRRAGQIPVRRGRVEAFAALAEAREVLAEGGCVVIYPEGTITKDPDGWPMVARTGLARLALETGVPVVPVGQWGARDLRRILRWSPPVVRVSVGEPVDLTPFRGRSLTGTLLREATEAVMDAVLEQVVAVRGGTPPSLPFDPQADPAQTRSTPPGPAQPRPAEHRRPA